MRTVAKIALCSALGAMIAASSVYAGAKLSLFINGKHYYGEQLGAVVEKETVLVPIDRIARQFQGEAVYDPDKNEVRVALPEAAKLSVQLERLEEALIPSTPKEALDTWAKGVRTRNGALQYAVFAPELRERTKADFESVLWVTGGSSPSMGAFGEVKEELSDDYETTRFSFDYQLVASYYSGTGSAEVIVRYMKTPLGEGWFITSIKMKDPDDTGVTIGVQKLEKP